MANRNYIKLFIYRKLCFDIVENHFGYINNPYMLLENIFQIFYGGTIAFFFLVFCSRFSIIIFSFQLSQI